MRKGSKKHIVKRMKASKKERKPARKYWRKQESMTQKSMEANNQASG